MAHTPLPWTAITPTLICHVGEDAAAVAIVADPEAATTSDFKRADLFSPRFDEACANSALIVKAVNCHQELVDALKALLANDRLVNLPDKGPSYDEGWQSDELLTLWSKVRAALAKAEA